MCRRFISENYYFSKSFFYGLIDPLVPLFICYFYFGRITLFCPLFYILILFSSHEHKYLEEPEFNSKVKQLSIEFSYLSNRFQITMTSFS